MGLFFACMASHKIQSNTRWSTPFSVLIADADAIHQQLSKKILLDVGFRVATVATGQALFDALARQSFDVLVLDGQLPDMDGEEICQRLRSDIDYRFLQVIMVTASTEPDALSRSLQIGANDFIRKPFSHDELRARVTAAANHKRMTDQLDTAESMLFALARMVEAKDIHTGDHCARLSHVAMVFGRELGLSQEEQLALFRGGVLHDLGKLGIPDRILLKAGPLDADEWAIMREHTTIGARLCGALKSMAMAVPIIQHHHERWDGSGYPAGLEGEEIPLLARVFQIVDVYDALLSERPYKKALPSSEVVGIMKQEMLNGWMDPHLTEKFLDIVENRPHLLRVPDSVEAILGNNVFDEILHGGLEDWGSSYKEEEKVARL